MAKAKAKSKSSKVTKRVEVKTPPKPKKQVNPIKEIVSALNEEPYNIVLAQARENVGDDLVKLREEVLRLDGISQSNYSTILTEIDKYKD